VRDKGRGGLSEVDGKWRAQLSLGKDPANGRKRYQSKRFTSRKAAEEWLRDNRVRVAVSTSGSCGELFDRWLTAQRHRMAAGKLSSSTFSWYASAISKHLEPLGPIGAAKVNSAGLQALLEQKTSTLGRSSLRRLTIILRAVFAYAVEEGWLQRSPALRLEVPEVEVNSHARVWPVDDVRRFLQATRETPLGPLWWLLAVTGMRRGEALGLKWDDVTLPDIGTPFIEIRRQYRQVDGRPEYAPVKTARSVRRFTIDPDTAAVLTAHRAAQQEAFGRDWRLSFPIFMRPDLSPFRPDYVSRKFQEAAKRLGLSPIGPHGLRHSLATALGEAGMPLLTVSRLLGHSSTRVTSDVYSHVFAETAGEAVALAAGKLRGA
jgi:integrase